MMMTTSTMTVLHAESAVTTSIALQLLESQAQRKRLHPLVEQTMQLEALQQPQQAEALLVPLPAVQPQAQVLSARVQQQLHSLHLLLWT
jgi:hypothetical protein